MKKNSFILALILASFLDLPVPGFGQNLTLPDSLPPFEIMENNQPDDGYLFLFARPQRPKYPGWFLIMDHYGTPVFYRYSPHKSGNFELQANGMISFQGSSGSNTMFYMMDSSFRVVDSVTMPDFPVDGHDFRILENGNYLMFALDIRNIDMSTVVEGGDPAASLAGVVIREVDPDKNTVFEWNSWNHFEITDSYSDLTASSIDLFHPNSLEIDEDGSILLISRTMDEITKISRQTGKIVYRLGGKQNQFSFADSTHRFSRPHDFRSLGNGHYTLFDNGTNRDPAYSRAVEYKMDTAERTIELVWEYDADKKVFARSGGSTRRLPSGNTIVCYGGQMNHPSVTEVHPDGSKAFELRFFDNVSAGRALKFQWRTNLFETNTRSVNFGMWDGYTESYYLLQVRNNAEHPLNLSGYSVRTSAFSIQQDLPLEISPGGDTLLTLVYYPSDITGGYITDRLTLNSDIHSDTLVQRIAVQVDLKGWKEDKDPPYAELPIDQSHNVPRDTFFRVEFSEAIRLPDDRPFDYQNADSLIILKKDHAGGEDVPFNAVIHSDLNQMTVQPDSALEESQVYYLAVSGQYEDYSGNAGAPGHAWFSTGDSLQTRNSRLESLPLNVYPNPAGGLFNVELPSGERFDLSVIDPAGRRVLHKPDREGLIHLDLRPLQGTSYILKVTGRNSARTASVTLIKH
jgi:hypothetical protein